jgi:hypothetical protein
VSSLGERGEPRGRTHGSRAICPACSSTLKKVRDPSFITGASSNRCGVSGKSVAEEAVKRQGDNVYRRMVTVTERITTGPV